MLAQGLVQVISGLSGLLLVRNLPHQQYAWFTIVSAMGSALAMLCDPGISNSVTAEGGKIWQDKARFSGLVLAAFQRRRQAIALAIAAIVPWTAWLLSRNGASAQMTTLLVILMIAPVGAIGDISILSVVNKLHSRLASLVIVDLAGAATKLLLIVLAIALAWLNTGWAVATAALALFIQGWIVRQQTFPSLDFHAGKSIAESFRPTIKSTVRHLYANTVFLCLQGQIATWIISLSGSHGKVADLGALNRLAIFYAILGTPIMQLIAPAFARCHDTRRLKRLFLASLAVYLLSAGTLLLFSVWRGDLILKLLGSNYSHLSAELMIVMSGFAIGGITSLTWGLNLARGWTGHVWLNIPITLAALLAALSMLDLSTVSGAAWLGVILQTLTLMHAVFVCALGFRKAGP